MAGEFPKDPMWSVTVRPAQADGGGAHVVTERIKSLQFEDDESKPDKLTLKVDNFDLSNFDAPIWKTGAEVEFTFGYAGDWSPVRTARITKVTGSTELTIEALDASMVMNKHQRVRTWEKMKRSEVAAAIAGEYGYGSAQQFIDDTEEVLEQVTQARMTDAQLLKDMARREGFEFFIDFDGFHWHKRKLGQAPVMTLRYYTAQRAEITKWNLENDIYARKAGSVKAAAIDPKTKKKVEVEAGNANAADATLAPQKIIISGISAVDGQPTGDLVKDTGSSVSMPSTEATPKTIERHAQGVYAKNQLQAAQLTMECIGLPQLVGKSVVRVEGIGNTLSGNYYCTNITHKLGGGYVTGIKCKRDGRSAGTNSAAQGSGAGTGTGSGDGVNSGGSTNDAPATNPDELVQKIDPVTGEASWVETRGRSNDSAPRADAATLAQAGLNEALGRR